MVLLKTFHYSHTAQMPRYPVGIPPLSPSAAGRFSHSLCHVPAWVSNFHPSFQLQSQSCLFMYLFPQGPSVFLILCFPSPHLAGCLEERGFLSPTYGVNLSHEGVQARGPSLTHSSVGALERLEDSGIAWNNVAQSHWGLVRIAQGWEI